MWKWLTWHGRALLSIALQQQYVMDSVHDACICSKLTVSRVVDLLQYGKKAAPPPLSRQQIAEVVNSSLGHVQPESFFGLFGPLTR